MGINVSSLQLERHAHIAKETSKEMEIELETDTSPQIWPGSPNVHDYIFMSLDESAISLFAQNSEAVEFAAVFEQKYAIAGYDDVERARPFPQTMLSIKWDINGWMVRFDFSLGGFRLDSVPLSGFTIFINPFIWVITQARRAGKQFERWAAIPMIFQWHSIRFRFVLISTNTNRSSVGNQPTQSKSIRGPIWKLGTIRTRFSSAQLFSFQNKVFYDRFWRLNSTEHSTRCVILEFCDSNIIEVNRALRPKHLSFNIHHPCLSSNHRNTIN